MFCERCGNKMEDDEKFCSNCGYQVRQEQITQQINEEKNEKPINIKNISSKAVNGKLKTLIGISVIIIIAVLIVLKVFMKNDSKEIIQKLQQDTNMYETEEGYEFVYDDLWTLKYTEENEFVKIEEPYILDCFSTIISMGYLGNDGTFSYDLDTGDINMYFDAEIVEGTLSLITYDLDKEEFILMVDGERYTPTEEFLDMADEYVVADTLKSDIEYFETTLDDMDLTMEEVKSLKYKDIKTYIDRETSGKESDEKKWGRNAEQQEAIDNAYEFLAGNTFYLEDCQQAMRFESEDTIRYIFGGEQADEYLSYSISSRYEIYKDNQKEWLTFITIDEIEYCLRIFSNGTMDLAGEGPLDGWYEKV